MRNNKTSTSQQPLMFHKNSTVGKNAVSKIKAVLGQVGCVQHYHSISCLFFYQMIQT